MSLRDQLDPDAAALYDAVVEEYFPVTDAPSGWGVVSRILRRRERDAKFRAFMYQVVRGTDHDLEEPSWFFGWPARHAIMASDDSGLVALAWQEIGFVERARAKQAPGASEPVGGAGGRWRLLAVSACFSAFGVGASTLNICTAIEDPLLVLAGPSVMVCGIVGFVIHATFPLHALVSRSVRDSFKGDVDKGRGNQEADDGNPQPEHRNPA